MSIYNKKSLLAISISMALSLPLLTACGGSDSESYHGEHGTVENKIDINKVGVFADNAKLTPALVASWEPRPVTPSEIGNSEETTQKMFIQGDNVVLFTRWHNSIVKFNKKLNEQTVNSQVFATLATAKEHVNSAEDDIVSGASEHTLTDVQYSKDGKYLYALVKAKDKNSIVDDDTYGLFKVTLNNDGSLPSNEVKEKIVTHRGNHVKRIQDIGGHGISDILSLNNGALLAWSGGSIAYFDKDFEPQSDKSAANTGVELASWAADNDTVYMLVQDGKQQRIEKRAIDNLATPITEPKVVEGFSKLLVAGSNIILVGKQNIQLFDKDFKKWDEVSINGGVSEISLSTDNSRLAVKNSNGTIFLVDIADNQLSTPIKVPLANNIIIGKFTLGDKNTLYYNSKSGAVSKINLRADLINRLDKVQDKVKIIESTLNNIDIQALNHGYPASAVIKDLELPTEDSNNHIQFTWHSSNSSAIDNQGNVNRTGQAQEVTLTVTGTMGDATESKDFKLTVLPTVAEKTNGTESNLKEGIQNLRYNYNYGQYSSNTANDDGSLYALFSGKNLVVLQKEPNGSTESLEIGMNNGALSGFDGEIKTVLWQGNNTLWLLLGNGTSGKLVKKEFSQNLEQNMDTNWELVKDFNEPVIAGFVNAKKTHITAVTKQNDKYHVQNFDNTGTIISDYTTKMNLSQNYVTVDDSGDYIFITTRDRAINGGTLYRLYKGNVSGEFAVDEPYHSGVVTEKGDFIAGGRAGDLLFVKDATKKETLTADDAKKVSFARAVDAKNGRIYSLALQGNNLFVSYRNIGTAIVDVSNFDKPFESSFVPYEGGSKFFLGMVSTDGNYLLQLGDRTNKFKITHLE